jgi:hypothetical protein
MPSPNQRHRGPPPDARVACPGCGWGGTLSDCDIDKYQESPEHPEYDASVCPKCGEYVDL